MAIGYPAFERNNVTAWGASTEFPKGAIRDSYEINIERMREGPEYSHKVLRSWELTCHVDVTTRSTVGTEFGAFQRQVYIENPAVDVGTGGTEGAPRYAIFEGTWTLERVEVVDNHDGTSRVRIVLKTEAIGWINEINVNDWETGDIPVE